jgi:hypothetical protein
VKKGKERHMRTMKEWKQILSQDIADMRAIERADRFFRTTQRRKRVREVGWHCYQVEEHLSALELQQLKCELEIAETWWRWYKNEASANLRAGPLARIRFLFTLRKTLQEERGNKSSPWVIPLLGLAPWKRLW